MFFIFLKDCSGRIGKMSWVAADRETRWKMSVKMQVKNKETLKIGCDQEQRERKLEKEEGLGSEWVLLPSHATSV